MSTGDGIVITAEAIALIVWVILALGYDQRIKRWEDRVAQGWRRRVRSSEFGVRRSGSRR